MSTHLGWWLKFNVLTGDTHKLPLHDMKAHNDTRQCWCTPTVTASETGAFVQHHAADRRTELRLT